MKVPRLWELHLGHQATLFNASTEHNLIYTTFPHDTAATVVLGVLLGVVSIALIVMTVLLLVAYLKKRTRKAPFNVQSNEIDEELL